MDVAEDKTKSAPCWVFIDNSNLFINGKKYFAKRQNLRVESDPRFRIDIGKLVDRVVGERTMSFGKLYGSEPKSLDSVWKAVRNQKLEVQVFERSKGGEEKEVDTAITADIVEECIVHKEKAEKGGVFIIISGDRDFCSSIEKLLKYEWLVEVYSWKACLSDKIKDLTKERKKFVKAHSLEELIFGTTKSTSPCVFKKYIWDPLKQRIPRHRTMVLCFDVDVTPSECEKITDKVTKKFKRPWMYCVRHYGDEYVLMVITCHEIDDINEIVNWYAMLNVVQNWGFRKCSKVMSLVEYYNQFDGVYDEDFVWQWKCDENDLGGAKKWTILRPKIAHSKDISSLPCRYQFSCYQGGKCGRQHSDDEKRFFKEHPNGKHGYKSRPCIYGAKWQKCKYENNSLLCPYAHKLEETRCYVCGKNGIHWMVDCPERDNQE